jgi:hypothetical protein
VTVEFERDPDATVVDALFAVSRALHKLGLADAATPMGAIESHSKVVMETGQLVASSLDGVAAGLHAIADAIAGRQP